MNNDLVYLIAKRVKELANKKIDVLRSMNGYDCNTEWEAKQKDKYKNRGEIIEELIIEEFTDE